MSGFETERVPTPKNLGCRTKGGRLRFWRFVGMFVLWIVAAATAVGLVVLIAELLGFGGGWDLRQKLSRWPAGALLRERDAFGSQKPELRPKTARVLRDARVERGKQLHDSQLPLVMRRDLRQTE
jgi:hypothetical protein